MKVGEDKHGNEIGCLKFIGILSATIFLFVVAYGALEGVGRVLLSIPWYLYIFVCIGFVILMGRIFGN